MAVGAQSSHSANFSGSNKANFGLDSNNNVALDIIGSSLGSSVVSGTSGLVLTSTYLGYKTDGGSAIMCRSESTNTPFTMTLQEIKR